jgi:lysyl-tRNA synthetase class 2
MKKTELDQEIIRINKIKQLIKLGINPYPAEEYSTNSNTLDIKSNYSINKYVCIAGRIMRINIIGKSCFISLQDHISRIQVYFKKNENTKILFDKLLDIGDIIGVEGKLFKTKVKEITVYCEKLKILAKAIKPIPQVKIDKDGIKHDEFINKEQRFRKRFLDLIVNNNVKNIFIIKNKIIKFIRSYLDEKEYIEVETPILQSIPGGAIAKPFTTHHNAIKETLYLRIANELYLKRLIIGGFKGVYELGKNFRNEGVDTSHNPEFTMLELYVSYKDYIWMMEFIEHLIYKLYTNIIGGNKIFNKNNIEINFQPPFQKISMLESIKKNTGYNITNFNTKQLLAICKKMHINILYKTKSKIIEQIFNNTCEKTYIQPTFIIDHPIETSPLSKKHRTHDNLTERFELIIDGKEICNAYSELNNPIEQLERFKIQCKEYKKYNNQYFIDENFIEALKYGMPPTAGVGIGIDRLTMILTEQTSIQEVLLFPLMKENK